MGLSWLCACSGLNHAAMYQDAWSSEGAAPCAISCCVLVCAACVDSYVAAGDAVVIHP
jgi:hypothetical protein